MPSVAFGKIAYGFSILGLVGSSPIVPVPVPPPMPASWPSVLGIWGPLLVLQLTKANVPSDKLSIIINLTITFITVIWLHSAQTIPKIVKTENATFATR